MTAQPMAPGGPRSHWFEPYLNIASKVPARMCATRNINADNDPAVAHLIGEHQHSVHGVPQDASGNLLSPNLRGSKGT
jgi:hypothetical protein